MQEHELKVTCVKTGKELVVSKRHYADNTEMYELVDGTPLANTSDRKEYKAPTPPVANIVEPEKDKSDPKPVAEVKEKPAAKKVAPPKV